ncbi:hypothetical protein YC2023_024865 [Brassica napus]
MSRGGPTPIGGVARATRYKLEAERRNEDAEEFIEVKRRWCFRVGGRTEAKIMIHGLKVVVVT